MPKVHSNLSQLDIKGAFVTAQNADDADDGVNSLLTIDYDEWLVCLGLCGSIKCKRGGGARSLRDAA